MSGGLPSGTAIPASVAAFVTLAQGALPANSTVWFGASLPTYTAPLTLQITKVVGDQQPAELGQSYRREETFSMYCKLTAYQGDQNFLGLLASMQTAFADIAIAVGNNPTLTGNVRYAEVGRFIVDAETDVNGKAAVNFQFDVVCQQRVTSLS